MVLQVSVSLPAVYGMWDFLSYYAANNPYA